MVVGFVQTTVLLYFPRLVVYLRLVHLGLLLVALELLRLDVRALMVLSPHHLVLLNFVEEIQP